MIHSSRLHRARIILGAGLLTASLAGCAMTGDRNGTNPESSGNVNHAFATETFQPYTLGTTTPANTLDGILFAGQPSPADLQQAWNDGIRTIINLRHENEITSFDERAFANDLGFTYVNIPWNGANELNDNVFQSCREALNTAERPILFHCGSANRVGAVWIPWRVLDQGISYDQALAEAKTIGLKTPAYEEKARAYVTRNNNR